MIQSRAKALLLLMRPVPLVIWSVPTVIMGFVLQTHRATKWPWALLIAVLGAMVLQGLVTHGLNDLYDWDSGTDKASSGIISGGSRVLVNGFMTPTQVRNTVIGAVILYGGVTVLLGVLRGPGIWVWALLGLYGSIAYSLPPLRLSYRPYLGEWFALFPAMISGVMLGGYAANSVLYPRLWWGAVIYGIFCVASVMQHHLSDIEADWQAHPQKRTTPCYWYHGLQRSPLLLVALYESLAMVVAMMAAIVVWQGFSLTLTVCATALVITKTTPFPSSPKALTWRDLELKLLSLGNVVGISLLALWH
jgi:1,4-dihydroxy-2-naphthoate octaprenyltransferase